MTRDPAAPQASQARPGPLQQGRPRGAAGRDAADVDEAVYDVVESIPPGRVSTYGAIGRLVGVGPRRVARALSAGGAAVPWHRVVRADGTAAEPVRVRQLELLAGEGVPLRGPRVDLAAVGWPD